MKPGFPRLLPSGDAGVSVEFGDDIDATINARVIDFDRVVRRANLPGVIETVPTYRALMVHLDPVVADHKSIFSALRKLARQMRCEPSTRRLWTVPVVYGGAHGQDIEALAKRHGKTPGEIIALHSAPVYRVYMVGFMPGFTYLGGLDPALHTPRLAIPRPRIPGGSISIGGAQTAIGAAPSPSGWHLIGQTPVRCFLPGRDPAFLFEAGDEVIFRPIPATDWDRLTAQATAGAQVATCEVA